MAHFCKQDSIFGRYQSRYKDLQSTIDPAIDQNGLAGYV
jgi:hypothetical protein